MTFNYKYNMLSAIVCFLVFSVSPVFAQPSAGDQWIERAFAYADNFWSNYNSEYGSWSSDCANFCSQIANAGCAGMCEWNNTDWPEWQNGYCEPYYWYYPYYPEDCEPCPTGWHQVIPSALNQSWWFYYNYGDWPDQVLDAHSVSDIPSWAGPGTFVCQKKTTGQWHNVFIGAGQGQNARYWAHTTDRHGDAYVTWLFGSGVDHVEFYGSGESPVNISSEFLPQANIENEGAEK